MTDIAVSPAEPIPLASHGAPMIAVIGMEGSGKTVLTTTLAKRLSTIDARGVFLNPQGVKTLRYVEQVWQTLQSGEWPPSTPPGQIFELRWKLQVAGEAECDLRLIDAAGQDLRGIFGEDQIESAQAMPSQLQSLAEYCRSSNVILFVVSLDSFIGEGDPRRRISNEAAIKSAMDHLSGHALDKRICLVLTKWDLFTSLASQRGGWLELLAQELPYIFSSHVRFKQIAVYPVSSVAQTRIQVDDNGQTFRAPKPGFCSEGLDELVDWLVGQVREIRQTPVSVAATCHSPPTSSAKAGPVPVPKNWPTLLQYARGHVVTAVVAVVLILFFTIWLFSSSGPKPVKLWEGGGPYGSGRGYGVTGWVTVENQGDAGWIRVTFIASQGGNQWTQSRDIYLESGVRSEVQKFSEPRVVEGAATPLWAIVVKPVKHE